VRQRTSWGRRLKWGLGVMSAVLVGVGAPVAAQTAPRAASPAHDEQPDPQAGQPDSSFSGYVGYAGADGAGSAAAPSKPDGRKAEGLGSVGTNSPTNKDVPGQPAESAETPSFDVIPLPSRPDPTQLAQVQSEVGEAGSARVIVMMRTPMRLEADLTSAEVDAQHEAIAESLDGLQATLKGTGSQKLFEYQIVPSAVYEVTPEGLAALRADPDVVSVVLDGQVESELASSTGVIDSDLLNAAGVLGNNFEGNTTGGQYQVAIIDSGVDGGHNAFTGRIVRQACFVTDNSCPGGTNSSFGAPSGEECTHSTDCDHGTHVGGIAAGGFFTGGHEGVARGAGIAAIKVAQDNPNSSRWTAFFSSIDSALQHVILLKNGIPPFISATNPNLVAVNLSIGTSTTFTAGDPACNAVDPTTGVLFGQLQALGVAPFVAAGNNGSNNSTSFPGCAPNAITVGATDDSDVPASFTNSSADLDFWAPGVSIDAPVPTGNNHGTKDGTSMATPHLVGAMALLRECVDGNGVPITLGDALGDLNATGVNVTRNGVTRKRINVLDAATRNVNNNDFAFPEAFSGNGPINDFDLNVCADSEAGEPGPFSVDNSIWWTWTPATTGTATISTEDSPGDGFFTTFDTTLTVYTGSTLGSLTPVAFDDDSGTGLRSLVTFPVNGGTTYRMKVDGFAAQNGLLNLHIQNGPPPACFGVAATIVGTINGEVINGTAGNDVIVAGDGNDTVNGFGGNDRICGGRGDDTINGGIGDDFVLGDQGSDVIRGEDGNDTLVGNPGGGSNDDANDTISGGAGNDFVDGWFGDDVLEGNAGDDFIRGAAGIDLATYATAPGPVRASLITNTATGDGNDTFVEVENLAGSAFNDVLRGNALVNRLEGRSGNDTLHGQPGNDILSGSAGRDVLRGGADDDTLLGGTDNDRLVGEAGNDTLNGGTQIDFCNGNAGADAAVACEVLAGIP
jgi:Ca2+-binding RTX toxin-like protein